MSPMTPDLLDPFESALGQALAEEAATVSPANDGLAQIRRRIAAGDRPGPVRRPRSPWLGTRGAILATAAVAALVTVLALTLVGGGSGSGRSVVPASRLRDGYPTDGIYPATSALVRDPSAYRDPKAVTLAWLHDVVGLSYLGVERNVSYPQPDVAHVIVPPPPGGGAVSDIELQRDNGTWVVVSARAATGPIFLRPALAAGLGTIHADGDTLTPAPGAVGPLKVQAVSADRGLTSASVSPRRHWSVNLQAPGATAVVATWSDRNGHVIALSATHLRPVRDLTPAPATLPAHFFAITNGATVDEYATATGRLVKRLTPQQSEVQLTDLQQSGTKLYYLNGGVSGCRNEIDTVDLSTGASSGVLLQANPGHRISGFATSAGRVAAVELPCSAGGANELVDLDQSSGSPHVITRQGDPPTVVGDPVWVDGGKQLAVIWRSGTQATVLQLDPSTATSIQGRQLCGGADYLPEQLAAAGGRLYTVAQQGRAIVVGCTTPQTGPSAVLPRTDQAGDLSAAPAGNRVALLSLSPGNSDVQAWLTGHEPLPVPRVHGLTSIAW